MPTARGRDIKLVWHCLMEVGSAVAKGSAMLPFLYQRTVSSIILCGEIWQQNRYKTNTHVQCRCVIECDYKTVREREKNGIFQVVLTDSGSLCCSRKAENSTSLSLVVPIERPCQAGTEGAGADGGSNPRVQIIILMKSATPLLL